MTFTISFGYWVIPTLITFISLGLAFWRASNPSGDPFAMLIDGFVILIGLAAATIVSLVSWCVYFAVT